MKKSMAVLSLILVIASQSLAIDPEKYIVGTDYETMKKVIFDDENLVSWFDNETIRAVSLDSGSLEVTFVAGKATEILITKVSKQVFGKYTTSLNDLLLKNAKVVSARLANSDNILGGAYLWKTTGVDIELAMFLDVTTGEPTYQIKKTATGQ